MKTAEEFLRDAHRKLSEPNPADWNQFDEIMKDEQGPAMIEAMKAYAEQFIDAAVEEAKITNPYQDARWLGLKKFEDIESYIHSHPPKINKQSILKLKEHLK